MAKKDLDKFTEKKVKPVAKPIKWLINIITLALIIFVVVLCHVGYYHFTDQAIKPDWLAKFLNQYDEKKSQEKITYSKEAIYSLFNYPKVDGSTATIPLAKALQANFTECDINTIDIIHSKTHQAYEKLINHEVDLILVPEPSQEELVLADNNNVQYDIAKIANEGFVFFTAKSNPVDSLTVEQIQGIYSGQITNWNQVGGNNEPIIAYQRTLNSESQIEMEKNVMQGKAMMKAPQTSIESGYSDINNVVLDYVNSRNALGYSFYYYAKTMYESNDIKILKINGVEPNNETIKSDEYPFKTAYYAVTLKGLNDKADKLKNEILSSRGQYVIEQAGYVPVK